MGNERVAGATIVHNEKKPGMLVACQVVWLVLHWNCRFE